MIGIFDSGLGGLSVAHAIRAQFKTADLLYYGDTRNAPYGEKSADELARLTVQGLQFLHTRGAGSIVSACNSISTSLAVSLLDAYEIPAENVIEMVGPTVASFKTSTARVLVVATTATVRSGIYQNAFRMIGKEIDAIPIPTLAGAIERGAPREEIDGIVRSALYGMPGDAYDTLILGCTHYPFVMDSFKNVLGGNVSIFDPAEAVAVRVAKRFWPREVGNGKARFVVSADTPAFRLKVAELFPECIGEIEVLQ